MVRFNKAIHFATLIMRSLLFSTQRADNVESSTVDRETNIMEHSIDIPSNTTTNLANEVELNQHGEASAQPNRHLSDDEISQPPITREISASLVSLEGKHQTLPDDLKHETKIALVLFSVSSGSVIAVTVVPLEAQKNIQLTHLVVFWIYLLLTYVSLFSAAVTFLLALYRPNMPCLVKMVRLILCVSLGSLLYAITSASSILLLGNTAGMILVVVVSLLVGIVLIIVVVFCTKPYR